ncbi:head maturation protease, ClpP-related [Nocardia pseudovaccinii]|uniref:head maturation protease, ClpP-related n=1 Tax=Nocardia pseudovaccinii TaxID=189540 RepID=UPI0007A476C1|nr:head maturation protease, ClpP-related [Nocardia pseudovaccinii]
MNQRIKALKPDGPARQWYSIRNAAESDTGPAVVYLFDEIDSYWGVAAEDFVRELDAITSDEIMVKINSPGGNVYDGLAIMNALRAHPAQITTSVEGLAASAASFIAMAGDDVIMRPGAEMMIHNAWGICVGNAVDMRELADQLDRTSSNLASIYAERAGGEVADWQAAMNAETWYSAEEAVEAGLADRVEKPGKDSAGEQTAKARFDLSIFNYAGRGKAPAPQLHRSPSAVRAEVKRKEGPTMPTLIEGLRSSLGLADDADEAAVLAAVDALQNAPAPAGDTPADPTLQQIAASAKRLGLQLVDATQYAATVAAADKGAKAFEKQQADHRGHVLNEAIRTGRIAKAQYEQYAKQLERDPEGTEAFLASLAPGLTVPLEEIGHAGEPDVDHLGAEMASAFAKVTGTTWKDDAR